jgi:hypothetical protein
MTRSARLVPAPASPCTCALQAIHGNGDGSPATTPTTQPAAPALIQEINVIGNKEKKTGGPAFPCEFVAFESGEVGNNFEIKEQSEGMTLRDYFAAHAPVTLEDAKQCWDNMPLRREDNNFSPTYGELFEVLASMRNAYAKTMLVAKAAAHKEKAAVPRDQVIAALQGLFDSYKRLADSGDAGNWSLEETDEGKAALAALAAAGAA